MTMSALFSALVVLLASLLALLVVADRRVTHAAGWEAIGRWLVVGNYAEPAVLVAAGAVIGCGLAWWISGWVA